MSNIANYTCPECNTRLYDCPSEGDPICNCKGIYGYGDTALRTHRHYDGITPAPLPAGGVGPSPLPACEDEMNDGAAVELTEEEWERLRASQEYHEIKKRIRYRIWLEDILLLDTDTET